MSNVFTLDAIKAEARKKFAPVTIGLSDDTNVELTSFIKLSKEDRKTVKGLLESLNDIEDEDESDEALDVVEETISKIFSLVANKPSKLLRALEDDEREVKLATMTKILQAWLEQAQVGGSIELADLIDRYGGCILADLQLHYGVDLRDLFSEDNPLSPRYVLTLLRYMPDDSATFAEMRGGQEFRGWNEDRYQNTAMVDAIRGLLYAFILAHTGKNSRKPAAPEPWPTPDRKNRKERQKKTPGSFYRMVAAQVAKKRKKKGGG
ncbi:tail assembly chaperone [Mycobacterium phage HINdeR]|uniref:Tail assembly chaperone n=1 Tax=Mycobacterium phage HINdeR TaxID=1327770 RepID=R4JEV4_9CAUD|nr:tail assembly chaperone [Mycobacterium phage HINdeR]AGK87503.1 tail assembly chaperone [Mycobacterium phage HINdeR]